MAGIKLNTQGGGSVTLQPLSSIANNVTLLMPGQNATIVDTATLAAGTGSNLIGYKPQTSPAETVQSRLRSIDTALTSVESLMDYSRLQFAATPLNNSDTFAIKQGSYNRRVTTQTIRTEFAAGAVAAQQAAELARDEAEVARDAAITGAAATLYPSTTAGLAATVVGEFFNVISADNKEYLNLYRHDAGPVATLIKTYPSVAGLDYKTARTIYVTTTGKDSNDGRSIKTAFRTINKALDTAATITQVTPPGISASLINKFPSSVTILENNFEAIITNLMYVRYPAMPTWSLINGSPSLIAFTERDSRTLLSYIIADLRNGQDEATKIFIRYLFDGDSNPVFAGTLLPAFVSCWEQIRLELLARLTDTAAESMVTALINMVSTVVQNYETYKKQGGYCVVIVHPGEYIVQPETLIPPNTALYGYDLRATALRLPPGQEENNMFRMSSGIKVRGFTFLGLRHEYQYDTLLEPPTKGWVFVFNDNEFITRSPYIADCSQLHDFTYDEMSLPIDRATSNPLMPRGGGNIRADGSVLSLYSPLRSVVVDSFTSINPNGVGYAIVKNAFVQLVSVFTNWSRVGVWSHLGGHVTIANSNNTFGDYAFAATGYRNVVQIEGVTPALLAAYPTIADTLKAATGAIVTNLMTVRYPTVTGWNLITGDPEAANLIAQTERDTRQLLQQIIYDLRSGQDRGIQFFAKGLFDWNANRVFRTSFVNLFVGCWEQMRLELIGRIADGGAQAMVNGLIALLKDVGQNPASYTQSFASLIEANAQQFSYAGSGVNYNAIPYSQRGTGTAPDPLTALYKRDGGRVYSTFSTEQGDTYLGTDLRVDFERNTIEGQAFSRGVQNITLPLIIALGG